MNEEGVYTGETSSQAKDTKDPHHLIDHDAKTYLNDIKAVLDAKNFESEEQKEILVANVFEEVQSKSFNYSMHHHTSHIMEQLLHAFTEIQLRKFFQSLNTKYVQMSFSCNGSRILEAGLKLLYANVVKNNSTTQFVQDKDKSSDANNEPLKSCEELIVFISDQIQPELYDMIKYNYPSHVARTLLHILSQTEKPLDPSSSEQSSSNSLDEDNSNPQNVSIQDLMQKLFITDSTSSNANHSRKGSHSDNFSTFIIQDLRSQYKRSNPTLPSISFSEVKQAYLAIKRATHISKPEILSSALQSSFSKICDEVETIPNIHVGILHPFGSPVLQVYISILSIVNRDRCKKFLKYLLFDSTTHGNEISLYKDHVGSHFIQKLLELKGMKNIKKKIYKDKIKPNLLEFSQHSSANYVIQTMVSNVKDIKQLKEIWRELTNGRGTATGVEGSVMKTLMEKGKAGVVMRLVESFDEFEVDESSKTELWNQICSIFSAKDDKTALSKFSLKFLLEMKVEGRLRPGVNEETARMDSIGSTIIQRFLLMEQGLAASVIKSCFIDDFEPEYITKMATDAAGSRVLEVIIRDCNFWKETEKSLMIGRKLNGKWAELAKNGSGSRIVEAWFESVRMDEKNRLLKEFGTRKMELMNDRFGRIVVRNLKIDLYVEDAAKWRREQEGKLRKEEMIKEFILEDDDGRKKQEGKQSSLGAKKEKKVPKQEDNKAEDLSNNILGFGLGTQPKKDKNKKRKRDNNNNNNNNNNKLVTSSEDLGEDKYLGTIMNVLQGSIGGEGGDKKNKKKKQKTNT